MAGDKRSDAQDAILDQIIKSVDGSARAVRDLAEAWAWLRSPSQSHGGGAATEGSK
jgi:hypothetical protein